MKKKTILKNCGLVIAVVTGFALIFFCSLPRQTSPVYLNPFDKTDTTLNKLIADQGQILADPQQDQIIGPLIVIAVDKINHKVTASPLKTNDIVDSAIAIDVYFDHTENDQSWDPIAARTRFYVKGVLKKSDERGLFFEASQIKTALLK